MNVFAGDEALYTPRKGEPERCIVERLTPKRCRIVVRRGSAYLARYVKPERLERLGGGY